MIWLYIKSLRYLEYYINKTQLPWDFVLRIFWNVRLKRYSHKTGFQIPPNTIGKGLTIWHWGTIIINESVRIGENLTIHTGVIIGHKHQGGKCPKIGNNVILGGGCKIIGDVSIGDNVEIAPNACITKDCESNMIYGGVPAKIIRKKI